MPGERTDGRIEFVTSDESISHKMFGFSSECDSGRS